jgi:hypothetical protein
MSNPGSKKNCKFKLLLIFNKILATNSVNKNNASFDLIRENIWEIKEDKEDSKDDSGIFQIKFKNLQHKKVIKKSAFIHPKKFETTEFRNYLLSPVFYFILIIRHLESKMVTQIKCTLLI